MRAMRREIERADVDAAPVVSEGGRSPSMLSTGLPGMTPNPSTIGALASGQRWSVARKREVVLRLLRGESVELVSRELCVPIYKLEQWREKADAALDGALKEATRRAANWPPPCSASASSAWRSSCCAPESGVPALWPAGGRGDG